jgi:hypothetical protein
MTKPTELLLGPLGKIFRKLATLLQTQRGNQGGFPGLGILACSFA